MRVNLIKWIIAIFVGVVSIMLVACSGTSSGQSAANVEAMANSFATSVPYNGTWNDVLAVQLTLQPDGELPALDSSTVFRIRIENMSQEIIALQSDYGFAIYLYVAEENNWVEVSNTVQYMILGEKPILLSPNGEVKNDPDMLWFVSIPIKPDLEIEEASTVRIVVIGNTYDNQTLGDEIGGYFDVVIEP